MFKNLHSKFLNIHLIIFLAEKKQDWIAFADPVCAIIVSAGDADPGTRLRRRRREVALANIILRIDFYNLTITLRLPYAIAPFRW
jgi:hypothetical protein